MYILSADLGKTCDYTAISTIKRCDQRLRLTAMERVPLNTSYVKAARLFKALRQDKALWSDNKPPVLVIDGTGVGIAVTDILDAMNVPCLSIRIHGGNMARREGKTIWVPKRDLIGGLLSALRCSRLTIDRNISEAQALLMELSRFKMTLNARTLHDSYNGSGAHDDTVLSLAIGVYAAEQVLS